MKYIKISILLSIGIASLNAQTIDKNLENYINKIVEKKLAHYKHLEQENIKLRKKVIKLEKRVAQLENDADALADKAERIETKTLTDKLNFGIDFHTTVNNYDKKYADGHKHNSNNLYTTKLSLNMKTRITPTMKFTGKLSMYKYWADSTRHRYSYFDSMEGRVPSGSGIFVDRAYVDWKFLDNSSLFPSVLTIGRQPSSDGPSHQFSANTTRKSTYSALVFDGNSDGIVLTTSLKNATPFKNAKIRLAYGKGFQNDQTRETPTNAFIGSDNSLKDTNVYGLFLESPILGVDNTLFQVGIVNMRDIIADADDTNASSNTNIGDLTFAGIMFEGTNVLDSKWDLFAHFAYVHSSPNGNVFKYNSKNYSLLGDGSDFSSKDANAFWIGARYTFHNQSKIGAEYNQGSKYWVSATQGSFDLINKLATRGKAYELYYIYPINRYSFLKLGGTYVDYDYTGSGWYLGKPKHFNELSKDEAKYSIESIKNIYLQFGIKY